MGVRSVQFSVDESMGQRKDALGRGITWNKVVEAGIAVYEGQKPDTPSQPAPGPQPGERLAPDLPPTKEEPPPRSQVQGRQHVENLDEGKGQYYLKLDRDAGTGAREFDVFEAETKMWRTVPFVDIPKDAMFRIRDDGRVAIIEGLKHFRKIGDVVQKDGFNYALIEEPA